MSAQDKPRRRDLDADQLRFQIDAVQKPAQDFVGSFVVTKQDAMALMQQRYADCEDDIIAMLQEELDGGCLACTNDQPCQCCIQIARTIGSIKGRRDRRNWMRPHLRNCDGNPCECGADPLPRIKP